MFDPKNEAITLEQPTLVRGLALWQIRRAARYMNDRLAEEIRLSDVAAAVNLSVSYFCTAFRLATGQTPMQWVNAARIARARELLTDPRHSITDVSLSVGYGTPSAFTSRFRQQTGSTPSQFRKLHGVDPLAARPKL